MNGMSACPRIILGALIWEEPSLLRDVTLQRMVGAFVRASWLPAELTPEMEVALTIEGPHCVRVQKLGIATIARTNTEQLVRSLALWQQRGRRQVPEKPSIIIGIGSVEFCRASLAFWKINVPDVFAKSVDQMIQDADTSDDGQFMWIDTSNPHKVSHDDIARLLNLL